MFTGLVEVVGTVGRLRKQAQGARLELSARWPDDELPRHGDSVAVNGACLTAVEVAADGFTADVSPETLARTLIGELGPGEPVNLERALRVGDRIGGHLVQGHVDGVVRLLGVEPQGAFSRWLLSLPRELAPEVARKGSVCLHGVSLTVAELAGDGFSVALIPATLEATVLRHMRPGARLHLETDVLAKYVGRQIGGHAPSAIEQIFGGGRSHA